MSITSVYHLLSNIQDNCIITHDNVRNQIFNDIDFSVISSIAPLWILEGGNSAESSISKTLFEKFVSNNNNILTNRLLYYYDFDMLVSALQDRFSMIESLLNKFYHKFSATSKYEMTDFDSFTMSPDSESFAYLNSIFIYLGSSFDIITKIAFEMQKIKDTDFTTYPRMASKNTQFGDRRKISNINIKDTIFEYPVVIKKIESIRNRIIHDGSFDFNQYVYTGWIEQKDIFECCILFPDFDDSGNFTSLKNRTNFYSHSNRINLLLPTLLKEVLTLICSTITELNRVYDISRFSNVDDIKKYMPVIKNWTISVVSILKKDLPTQV